MYVVKSGDTLSGIAVKYGTTASAILALNPDLSRSTLVVGTRVKVPKPVPLPLTAPRFAHPALISPAPSRARRPAAVLNVA